MLLLPNCLLFPLSAITLSLAIECLQLLAGVAVVFISWRALQTWREQYRGQRNAEIALTFLRAAHKFSDHVSFIRNPFVSSEEQTRIRNAYTERYDKELPRDSKLDWHGIATLHRINESRDAYMELIESGVESQIVLATDSSETLDEFRRVWREIRKNAELHQRWYSREPTDFERWEAICAVIWKGYPSDDEDPIQSRLNAALEDLIEKLTPFIRLQ